MKNVIIAFDGTHFSEGAMEFARRLNLLQPILLTGVFLPQVEYASLWSAEAGAMAGGLFVPLAEETHAAAIQTNINRFEKICSDNNIRFRTHKDFYDFVLPGLKEETRFADLLIVGTESFCKGTEDPSQSLQDVLRYSECPVVLVPEKFDFPESIILAYDGTESSIYAIKQFSYLFPELCDRKTILVFIEEDADDSFPSKDKILELASWHFDELGWVKLNMNQKKYFNTWISEKKGGILVCGAFGRSALSLLFKKSFSTQVIADHQLPVFIAHK